VEIEKLIAGPGEYMPTNSQSKYKKGVQSVFKSKTSRTLEGSKGASRPRLGNLDDDGRL
jgi:hypothetical protein